MKTKLAALSAVVILLLVGCQLPTAAPVDPAPTGPAPSRSITFHANGGTGATASQAGPAGSTVTLSDNGFVRAGYAFSGWNTAADRSGRGFVNLAQVVLGAADLDLYAQWTPTTNLITFSANGGSGTLGPLTALTGTQVSLPLSTLYRAGYTFVGWNTNADGSGMIYGNGAVFKMGASGLLLYARWVATTNSISFQANGGSGSVATLYRATDDAVTLPPSPLSRAGYTFTGWNTSFGGSGTPYNDGASFTMGSASMMLYAQWRANVYQLSFHPNGGSGSPSSQSVTTGTAVSFPANPFSLPGYRFTGWNTAPLGSGTAYAAVTSLLMGPSDLQLYAQWSANTNTISFNANGGWGATDPQTAATGSLVTLSNNRFHRDGYTFAGWNTDAEGPGSPYGEGSVLTMGASSLLLYARWTADTQAVTYDANGGTGTSLAQTTTTGTFLKLSDNPFHWEGYTFTGWNTKANGYGTEYQANSTVYIGTSGLVLYAHWSPDLHSLTFDANGGSGTMWPYSTSTGSTVYLDSLGYYRTGYAFTGWNTEVDGSGITYPDQASFLMGPSALLLHAQWEAISNTIAFDANGGDGSLPSTTADTDSSVTLPPCTLTREGYTFTGWNTEADQTGTDYADRASFPMVPTSLHLFAQWTPQVNTLSFQANGGTGLVEPLELLTGQSWYLPQNLFTRDGYRFTGWNTRGDGSGKAYGERDWFTMEGAGQTLFAQWSNTASVEFPVVTPPNYYTAITGPGTVFVGVSSTFTSYFSGHAAGYAWYFNGRPLPGETSATLQFSPPATGVVYGINQLMLAVKDTNGVTYSVTKTLTISH